jgi:Na+/H+ antiporter NhaD/arsenite permease-like protein
MLATTVLTPSGLIRGVVGDDRIQPYAIVIVFLGLAYLAAALDATGALAALALAVARRSRGRGRPLYLLFFLLSSALTVATSNDVCVMALAPLILYTCASASVAEEAQEEGEGGDGSGTTRSSSSRSQQLLDPTLYLYSMFAASNLASIALMFGNPTNLIVAVAARMTFWSYARAMALPALAATLAALACLYLLQNHRNKLPERVSVPATPSPKSLVSDSWGAAFSSLCLLVCLAVLAAAPSVGWALWPPVLGCCGVQLAFSVARYGFAGFGGGWGDYFEAVEAAAAPAEDVVVVGEVELLMVPQAGSAAAGSAAAAAAATQTTSSYSSLPLLSLRPPPSAAAAAALDPEAALPAAAPGTGLRMRRRSHEGGGVDVVATVGGGAAAGAADALEGLAATNNNKHADALAPTTITTTVSSPDAAAQPPPPPPPPPLFHAPIPTVLGPVAALPLHIVPFTLGMFCMVEGLAETGVVDMIGRALGLATAGGNPYLAALVVGVAATFACNVINNQPMTVLFTRALLSPGGFAAGAASGGAAAATGAAAAVAAASSSSSSALNSALFATVIASNVGANFTLVGALAGVMFADIVRRKEREAGVAAARRAGVGAAAVVASASRGGGGGGNSGGVDVSYAGFFRMLAPSGAASLAASLGVLMAATAGGLV